MGRMLDDNHNLRLPFLRLNLEELEYCKIVTGATYILREWHVNI